MNLTELELNYDKYLSLNYNSKDTISSYKNCFKKFVNENDRVYRLSNEYLKDYFISFNEKYSASYYNQMLSSLIIVYKILKQPRKLSGISYKKDHPKHIVILSRKEIIDSLKVIQNIKHKWLIKLLYIGALRSAELLNIKITDIDSANNRISINNGKGGFSRYIPITDEDIDDLRQYFKKYRPITYLFEGQKEGNPYTKTSLRKVVLKIQTSKHVHPHLLRHTAITNLVDDGHNLLKVQNFAGHKTPKSTNRYYHLSEDALSGMMLKTA